MPPRLPQTPGASKETICRSCSRKISSSRKFLEKEKEKERENPLTALAANLDPSKNPSSTKKPRLSPQTSSTPQRESQFSYLRDMMSLGDRKASRADPKPKKLNTLEELEQYHEAVDLEKQMSRRWQQGDVYAPHDLSPVEMLKWKKRNKPTKDAFDELAINPINEYKNFSMMAEYTTEMGRIKHSRDTALRPVNQRRMAKAIRRAVGIGLIPSAYRHPELLDLDRSKRARAQR